MTKLNKQQQQIYDLMLETLKKKKVRLTDIRLAIIQNLIVSDHPTPASIVKSLEEEYGKINVMSVYNTIDLLLEEHLVSANTFNGKQISYEIIMDKTAHFKCLECDKIYHLSLGNYEPKIFEMLQKLGNQIDFKVDHYKIEVHGICHDHDKN
jgi:Fe2+ or Zn2+ uptake regulation protein